MKPNIQDFTIGMPDRLETIDVKAGSLMIGSFFSYQITDHDNYRHHGYSCNC